MNLFKNEVKEFQPQTLTSEEKLRREEEMIQAREALNEAKRIKESAKAIKKAAKRFAKLPKSEQFLQVKGKSKEELIQFAKLTGVNPDEYLVLKAQAEIQELEEFKFGAERKFDMEKGTYEELPPEKDRYKKYKAEEEMLKNLRKSGRGTHFDSLTTERQYDYILRGRKRDLELLAQEQGLPDNYYTELQKEYKILEAEREKLHNQEMVRIRQLEDRIMFDEDEKNSKLRLYIKFLEATDRPRFFCLNCVWVTLMPQDIHEIWEFEKWAEENHGVHFGSSNSLHFKEYAGDYQCPKCGRQFHISELEANKALLLERMKQENPKNRLKQLQERG